MSGGSVGRGGRGGGLSRSSSLSLGSSLSTRVMPEIWASRDERGPWISWSGSSRSWIASGGWRDSSRVGMEVAKRGARSVFQCIIKAIRMRRIMLAILTSSSGSGPQRRLGAKHTARL